MKVSISLETKVNTVFIFTFLLLCFILFYFHYKQDIYHHQNISNKYKVFAKYIHRNRLPPDILTSYLETLNFTLVKMNDAKKILRDSKSIFLKENGFEIVINDNRYYLHIITRHFKVLFQDELNYYEKEYLHFIIFAFILSLFIIIYYLIIKNIKEKDLLLNSRQLFLRTIMHELKTPIAKGRIVSELIDDTKQKDRMITIFEKLNFLINDFAKVEQIISKNYNYRKKFYKVNDILNYSTQMLILDKNEIDKVVDIRLTKEISLKVDLELISMAIKNIIDNGIKYSKDKKVFVKQKDNQIFFISNGDKLPKPLEEYFKPFHNETTSKSHGMGLGLYIVKSIIDIHKFDFRYEYKSDKNIFIIEFN